MADMAGSGALDLSVLEHHTFPLAEVNDALDTIPHGTAASPTSSACPEAGWPERSRPLERTSDPTGPRVPASSRRA